MFNKLYIEPPKSPTNQLLLQQIQQPTETKLNVSRYPRTSLPSELKMKFEVDTRQHSICEKRKTVPNSPRTSEYANLYNDEFWRQQATIESK